MEIRSAIWQRVFAICVFGCVGLIGLGSILKAFWPERIGIIDAHSLTPAVSLASGSGLFLFSLYCWWRTERYCVCADAEGIIQYTGFHTTHVLWRDVAWYRLEPLRGTTERKVEPVLYDSAGRVLLRPVAPMLLGTGQQDEERAQFWQYVESKLKGKQFGV